MTPRQQDAALRTRQRVAQLLDGRVTQAAGKLRCLQRELLVPGEAGLAVQRLAVPLEQPARFGATGRRPRIYTVTIFGEDGDEHWLNEYVAPLETEITRLLMEAHFRPHVRVFEDGTFTVEAAAPGEGR